MKIIKKNGNSTQIKNDVMYNLYLERDVVLIKTQILSAQKGISSNLVPKRDGPYKIRAIKSLCFL